MYLIDNGTGSVVPVHARIQDHLAARLHADRIDAALASGASPDASIASAVRSRALSSTRSRHRLAHGLRRALTKAHDPWAASATGVPVNSVEIISAAPEILELERLLLARGPVSVRGVAQVRALLTNGTGPLYSRRAVTGLDLHLHRAIEAMTIMGATMSGAAA
jgi:hypothetical protein